MAVRLSNLKKEKNSMVAEVSSTPKTFESLDALFSWLLGQLRRVADEGGAVLFNRKDAQTLLTAYDSLKEKEVQV